MLFVYFGRGFIAENDTGVNENYYLYNCILYQMISPNFLKAMYCYIMHTFEDGSVSGKIGTTVGGVQFIRIVLLF